MRKLTTNDFIEKSKIVHGGKFDYSLVDYKNSKTKVKIICQKHGVFECIAAKHLFGTGCHRCAGGFPLTKEEFIKKANKIHGDKYDYSNSIFKSTKNKIEIKCLIHDSFLQSPERHMIGAGCPKCANKNITTEEFIKRSKKIFGDEYDYSLVEYSKNTSKVNIICKDHGVFQKTPKKHLSGQGCQKCTISSGEKKIFKILKTNRVKFNIQHKFNDCVSPITNIKLKFDFYLLDHETCIEYHGLQHFKPISHFGGYNKFLLSNIMDEAKEEYCKKNKISLIIIFKENENIPNYKYIDLFGNSNPKLKKIISENNILEKNLIEYKSYKNTFNNE